VQGVIGLAMVRGNRRSGLWEWRSGRGGIIPPRHSAEGSSIGAKVG
jgi:hypothetical protein